MCVSCGREKGKCSHDTLLVRTPVLLCADSLSLGGYGVKGTSTLLLRFVARNYFTIGLGSWEVTASSIAGRLADMWNTLK
jgi:hypothetical protein